MEINCNQYIVWYKYLFNLFFSKYRNNYNFGLLAQYRIYLFFNVAQLKIFYSISIKIRMKVNNIVIDYLYTHRVCIALQHYKLRIISLSLQSAWSLCTNMFLFLAVIIPLCVRCDLFSIAIYNMKKIYIWAFSSCLFFFKKINKMRENYGPQLVLKWHLENLRESTSSCQWMYVWFEWSVTGTTF